MSISINDVFYIAKLANLKFTDDEALHMQKDMNQILSYMDKLNELDTSSIKPLTNINTTENVLRDDEVKPSLPNDIALKNAPSKLGPFFRVPKVIGNQ